MTLKIKRPSSVKLTRKLHRIPAKKRLADYFHAGWLKRYRQKNTCRRAALNKETGNG